MSLELILLSLVRLWASFWDPVGRLGSQGAHLGVTWGSLWLPWDAGGPLWDTLGSQVELGMTLGQSGRPFPLIFGAFAMPAHTK